MGRIFLVVVCCVVGGASVAAAQCPDGTPRPAGGVCAANRRPTRAPPAEAVRARHIMLLPFRNVTRVAANDWLVAGAPLMLGEALGQFTDLSIVPEQRLTAAMRRFSLDGTQTPDATQLSRLADETGGWTAVTGNIIANGTTLRISAQAFDVPTSRVIAQGSTTVEQGADVRPAFDRLSVQLLQAVGVQGATSDLVALTTRSVDAYRLYVDGVALIQRGAFRRAEAALKEAVRRDSTFALAWVKLALTGTQVRGPVELINPASASARAVEQAARNSTRLPPRQAGLVRALQALFHGQFARSTRLADSLLATDSSDVEAREWLAIVKFFDTRLDTNAKPPRRIASFNQAIELSREVLERDPGRFEMFVVPVTIHAFGAGFPGTIVAGRRKEAGSLAAEFLMPADVLFVPVLGDSIELMVDTTFNRLPLTEQARLRLRAIDGGMAWVNRWFAASPDDPEPYLWASRFEELRGNYPLALEWLAKAESLGVESLIENVAPRRLSLLELSGRYAAAEALADSLLKSANLGTVPFMHWIDRTRIYLAAVLLRSKQWDKAAALVRAFGPVPAGALPCSSLETEMTGYFPKVPAKELRAIMDTAANHFGDLLRTPGLSPCAEWIARGFVYDSLQANRPAAATALLRIADSLHRAGNDAGGYRAGRTAIYVDTARRSVIAAIPWLAAYARAAESASNFEAGDVDVYADSVVVSFRFTGREPLMIDPGISMYRSFSFVAAASSGGDTTEFVARMAHTSTAVDTLQLASLPAYTASMNARYTSMSHWPAARRVYLTAVPDVTATGNAIRLTVRGPIAAELRKAHPDSGRFYGTCYIATDGLCARPLAPIRYH